MEPLLATLQQQNAELVTALNAPNFLPGLPAAAEAELDKKLKAKIDAGIDEMYNAGVRGMFVCHKFDNALCGVRFDSDTQGIVVNAGTVVGSIRVCVPRTGYTDVRISTPVVARTYGDMRDVSTFGFERRLGVFLSSIALADEIGPPCRP